MGPALLQVVSAVSQSFKAIVEIFSFSYLPILNAFKPGNLYRQNRFGYFGHFLYISRLVDTDALQDLHWNINTWTDEEVMAWKQSQLSTYNAIAVAGAIFAGIGLTALQIPNMFNIHWTARALCSSSMLLGIFSVSVATSGHQTIARLNSALSVRLWLSRGKPTQYLGRSVWTSSREHLMSDEPGDEKYKNSLFEDMPLESSISSLKVASLPRHLLDLAVLLFVVGFGLYYLFMWLDNIEEAALAHRNFFIAVMVTAGLYVLYAYQLWKAQDATKTKRLEEFGFGAIHQNLDKVAEIMRLQQELRRCQNELNFLRGKEDGPS
ncbi:hypothetical protein LTR64_007858 [Lithohypha guttulata]|uniref:uncharacterized protein n=1 Tax=Lithohypha guttulata TaxID=1690604 RepID=UPI002DDF39CA|nr:hypothetical protein LTR51_008275 [Lithohypha guttulata]